MTTMDRKLKALRGIGYTPQQVKDYAELNAVTFYTAVHRLFEHEAKFKAGEQSFDFVETLERGETSSPQGDLF